MDYTIKLTSVRNGSIYHINNVVADGIIDAVRVRWFLTAQGQRHEVPMDAFLVEFSEGRARIMEEHERQKQAQKV